MSYLVDPDVAPDADTWLYRFTVDGHKVYANNITDATAVVINPADPQAYLRCDPATQLALRDRFIHDRFGPVKAELADFDKHPEFAETFKLMDATDVEIAAFTQPLDIPVVGLPDYCRWRFDKHSVPEGRDPIPLYVVTTQYWDPGWPSLKTMPQGSSVVILDPEEEAWFIKSLDRVKSDSLSVDVIYPEHFADFERIGWSNTFNTRIDYHLRGQVTVGDVVWIMEDTSVEPSLCRIIEWVNEEREIARFDRLEPWESPHDK